MMGDLASTGVQPGKTHLAFHYDGKLLNLQTSVVSLRPFSALEQANQQLFTKNVGSEQDLTHILVTKETIFHPQGGGQPSDKGQIRVNGLVMAISAVRMDAVHVAQVLHLGRFEDPHSPSVRHIRAGAAAEQIVDAQARLLYSRLHTAGHVLGSAVRRLVEDQVPGFDELKASHFPDSAACEFQGLIDGKWKPGIQALVDEYVKRGMPVEIEFWSEDDFRREGLERLIPDRGLLAPGESRFRVVRIVGADVYPCGGTHVDTTDLCGATTVKKISRSKGVSRVSYTVAFEK